MSLEGSAHNYYKILGVPRDASIDEIHDAYGKMMQTLEHVPSLPISRDVLELAAKTLTDPKKRRIYDDTLPKGIYYFEETQVFSWNPPTNQPKEADDSKAQILQPKPVPHIRPPTPTLHHERYARTPKPRFAQHEGLRTRGDLFHEYHDSSYWLFLCLGLFSPSITIFGLIVYFAM